LGIGDTQKGHSILSVPNPLADTTCAPDAEDMNEIAVVVEKKRLNSFVWDI
jgi:hypothetical protein